MINDYCIVCKKGFLELGINLPPWRLYCIDCGKECKRSRMEAGKFDWSTGLGKLFRSHSRKKQLRLMNKRSKELLYEKKVVDCS